MLKEIEKQQIKEAFKRHTVIGEQDCKCWLVKVPDKFEYWFRVTWSPGTLTVSGDVGEIVISHYQAMPTWEEAVKWILGADHCYLMQKSNKTREFDQEETIKQIVLMADEYLNEYDDDTIWSKLADLTHIPLGNMTESKKKIIKELENSCDYFESHADVYHFMDNDADWTGSTKYNIDTYYQYAALQVWAESVVKEIK